MDTAKPSVQHQRSVAVPSPRAVGCLAVVGRETRVGMTDPFIIMKPAEVQRLVRDAVREEVAKVTREDDDVMTREQVAELLKVSERTVLAYVKDHGLPGRQLGGHMWRFRRSAVLAWAEGRGT